VTARVSHRPHAPLECGPQGLRRPRFSFFRFNCQTASLISNGALQSNSINCVTPQQDFTPTPKRSLPGLFNRVVLRPEKLERNDQRPPLKAALQSMRAYRSSPLPLSTGVFKKLQKPPPWLSVPCESTRFPGSLLACSAICPTNQTLARNVLRDGLRPHNRVPKSRLPFALPECLTSLTSSNFSRFQNYVGRVSAGGKFAHRPHQSRLTSGPAGGLLCLDPVVTPH
jgi:hypothetical protein